MEQAPDERITVAVVHGASIVRAGIRALVEMGGYGRVAMEACTLEEMEPLLRTTPVQVLVLELALPLPPVLHALDRLEEMRAAPWVMVLGGLTDRLVQHLVQARVRAVLPDHVTETELQQAVTTLALGGLHSNAWMLARLGAGRNRDAGRMERAAVALTATESKVLRWLCRHAGATLAQIAAMKQVNARTIGKHRDVLHRKLRVHSRAELLARAQELRLF